MAAGAAGEETDMPGHATADDLAKRVRRWRIPSIIAIAISVPLACLFGWVFFFPGSGCAGLIAALNALVASFWGAVLGLVLTGLDTRRAGLRSILTCFALVLNAGLAVWTAFIFMDLVF